MEKWVEIWKQQCKRKSYEYFYKKSLSEVQQLTDDSFMEKFATVLVHRSFTLLSSCL